MRIFLLIGVFFILLFSGAPILVAMGASGMAWILSCGGTVPVMAVAQKIYTATDSFALMAVPFFMLSGQIMEHTGITQKLVDFADAVIGWVRGGLACVVELAGMLLAGISGSSNADASALGSLMVRALRKGGYDDGWAVAITSSAASIGPIIPPSCVMIIYANQAGLNIGKLFMGGIIPGILLGIGYMIISVLYAKKRNIPRVPFKGWAHLGRAFIDAIWALLMPVIIIGGILSGIFTATESGCIACIYGLLYGLIAKKFKTADIPSMFKKAMISSVGALSLIAFSQILGFGLAREGLPGVVSAFCNTYLNSRFLVLLFVIVICVIAGMFIDNNATMLILTPIMMPIIRQMGIDVQQFSIIFMIAIMSGGLTPPVGGLLFITSSVENIALGKCIKPVIPFVLWVFLLMIIMCFVPGISTWIPTLVGYR